MPQKIKYSKLLHRYLGMPLCVFAFLAGLSGILLNHRDALKHINIPRFFLPDSYTYKYWNRASVRSALALGDSLYIYGNAGVWLADRKDLQAEPIPYNAGLGEGGMNIRYSPWQGIV